MSFSSEIKQELNKNTKLSNKELVKYELIGYLISGNIDILERNIIRFSTESDYNINRFSKLLYNLKIEHNIEISGKNFIVSFKKNSIQEFVKIDEKLINSTEDLIETVNNSQGRDIKVQYIHQEETKECSISPVKTSNSQYKLGLCVRDSAAGVGTVSFYEPTSKTFGALGHGITDIDTNELINIASGEFVTTRILNITKGESGNPGKIQGTVENQTNIGKIYKNSKFGIYGKVDNISSLNIDMSKEMEVALREEIKTGKATILCSLDNQQTQEYEIEIEKINKENNYDNKSMQIKITDPKLLEKTGGIIQGMSGSPVIQNGKFVGAVTHVLVNDPTKGYAVFGDIMLKQSKNTF